MGKKRIVIADDHSIIREGLRLVFNFLPEYEIVGEAKDGIEALNTIKNLRPDLVLMDLSMPEMDGFEVTKIIKATHPEIKIVAFAMYQDEGYMLKAFEVGADAYVVKSASKDELISTLKRAMSGEPVMENRCG